MFGNSYQNKVCNKVWNIFLLGQYRIWWVTQCGFNTSSGYYEIVSPNYERRSLFPVYIQIKILLMDCILTMFYSSQFSELARSWAWKLLNMLSVPPTMYWKDLKSPELMAVGEFTWMNQQIWKLAFFVIVFAFKCIVLVDTNLFAHLTWTFLACCFSLYCLYKRLKGQWERSEEIILPLVSGWDCKTV